MEPSKDSDIEIVLEGELHQPIFPEPPTSQEEQIDIVRAAVGLTKEAARAISITAIEAVREGALFMGVIGSRGSCLIHSSISMRQYGQNQKSPSI